MSEIAPILTAIALLITAIGSVVIALYQRRTTREVSHTRAEVGEVHVLVNNNLTEVKAELARANARWDALVAALGQHPDAARIFSSMLAPRTIYQPPEVISEGGGDG